MPTERNPGDAAAMPRPQITEQAFPLTSTDGARIAARVYAPTAGAVAGSVVIGAAMGVPQRLSSTMYYCCTDPQLVPNSTHEHLAAHHGPL